VPSPAIATSGSAELEDDELEDDELDEDEETEVEPQAAKIIEAAKANINVRLFLFFIKTFPFRLNDFRKRVYFNCYFGDGY
jgi:hypothetical protein